MVLYVKYILMDIFRKDQLYDLDFKQWHLYYPKLLVGWMMYRNFPIRTTAVKTLWRVFFPCHFVLNGRALLCNELRHQLSHTSNTFFVWTMYLYIGSVKFVLQMPSTSTLTKALLFCWALLFCDNLQTLIGALRLGRALLIWTLRYFLLMILILVHKPKVISYTYFTLCMHP